MEDKMPELRLNMRGVWGDSRQIADAIELLPQAEKWHVTALTKIQTWVTRVLRGCEERANPAPVGKVMSDSLDEPVGR